MTVSVDTAVAKTVFVGVNVEVIVVSSKMVFVLVPVNTVDNMVAVSVVYVVTLRVGPQFAVMKLAGLAVEAGAVGLAAAVVFCAEEAGVRRFFSALRSL